MVNRYSGQIQKRIGDAGGSLLVLIVVANTKASAKPWLRIINGLLPYVEMRH